MDNKLQKRLYAMRTAFVRNRPIDLKKISNDLINEAALKNDSALAELSIIAYALNKLLSKRHIVMHGKWESAKGSIVARLDSTISSLEKGRLKEFRAGIGLVGRDVNLVDSRLGNFVQSILGKARIKMASSAYATGMSLGQAAALTSADKKHLQSYIGFTKIHDEAAMGEGIRERLRKLEEILG